MADNEDWSCLYGSDPRTVRMMIPVMVAGYLVFVGSALVVGALVARLIARLAGGGL